MIRRWVAAFLIFVARAGTAVASAREGSEFFSNLSRRLHKLQLYAWAMSRKTDYRVENFQSHFPHHYTPGRRKRIVTVAVLTGAVVMSATFVWVAAHKATEMGEASAAAETTEAVVAGSPDQTVVAAVGTIEEGSTAGNRTNTGCTTAHIRYDH